MGLLAKKVELESKLASLHAQLDIVKDMLARGETEDVHGTISDHILHYLKHKPDGAGAKDIVMFVSAMTGANETSVRTRISKLVSQKRIYTDGREPFTYKVVQQEESLSQAT